MKLTELIREKIHIDKQFNVNPENEPTGDEKIQPFHQIIYHILKKG
jgi:hypothetical protein